MAFNNYLEDENDKPYFTTNSLAYYYDKMEGFAKAVEGSAKELNLTKEEIEQRIALRLAEWDKNLESFDGSVEKLLTEWVDDGTLTPLIDSTLIDRKIAPVTAQLAEKVTKEELNALGKLSLSGTYATVTDLQNAYPTGANGLFLVIGDGFVYRWDGSTWLQAARFQGTGIADKTVTVKTLSNELLNTLNYKSLSFSQGYFESIPLNNKTYVDGTYSTGIVYSATRLVTSHIVPVKRGDVIHLNDSSLKYNIHYFNENGTIKSQGASWIMSDTVFESAQYIAIQLAKNDNSTITPNEFEYEKISLRKSIIPEKDKIVDLVLFMGQSNMAGRGVASESPVVPVGNGFEFRAISDPTKLYNVVEPFGKIENNTTSGVTETTKTGSLVSSFVNEYFNKTGIPIVGVSCSKGGTSIDFWQPSTLPLNDAIVRYRKAENWLTVNGYTIRHKYMVWCQGETDGDNTMPITEYKDKLTSMVNAMTTEGIEKCFLIRIGNHRDNATIYNPIIQAQTEVAKVNEKIVLVSTKFDKMASDGLMKDTFHYTQLGYNIVGAEAGRNTAFYVNNGKEPTMFDWENDGLYFSYKS